MVQLRENTAWSLAPFYLAVCLGWTAVSLLEETCDARIIRFVGAYRLGAIRNIRLGDHKEERFNRCGISTHREMPSSGAPRRPAMAIEV